MSAARWALMALVVIAWLALAYALRCWFRRLDQHLAGRLATTRGTCDRCLDRRARTLDDGTDAGGYLVPPAILAAYDELTERGDL